MSYQEVIFVELGEREDLEIQGWYNAEKKAERTIEDDLSYIFGED